MFGRRVRLFTLFGFSVRADMSWLIVVVLVTWTLASGLFPHFYEGLDAATYWCMGVCGALGLFGSIVFHEMCHSLAARGCGVSIKGITLFIFGGVAEMEQEPPSAKAEFFIAAAGPASSIALGLGFLVLSLIGQSMGGSTAVVGVLRYLASINGILVMFNLIPGFPLDGGRVLRSILWYAGGNLTWATRVAARIGAGFGMVLILLGVVNVLAGSLIGGLWWFLIGLFLRHAAQLSYQRLVVRQALEGETVRRFMNPDVVTVAPAVSVEQLVEDYIYRYHFKMFPVVVEGRLAGCVGVRRVKDIPRPEWRARTVEEITEACGPENSVHPDDDATEVLSTMYRLHVSRLLVIDDGKLVGIISLKDLLAFLALKMELEGRGTGAPALSVDDEDM